MFRELLAEEFFPYGTLSSLQLDLLVAHYKLLMRWNERINLTRIRKLDEIVRFHYCESLFLASNLPSGPLNIVDIGSGAGFPGIPLAIYRPDLHVTLIESHQRKAVFLAEARQGIANLKVRAIRAESCPDRFDWAISRAVVPTDVLSFGLAANYGLLIGHEDAAELPSSGRSIQIPWGSNRELVMFHVERDII